jgi:hypothetical protein
VPTAAKPAATAASFATCFRVEVLGRMDFFAFVGRLAFVVLLLFDLAPARFNLVFDVTRRFDAVFNLARFFAFFMILPIRFSLMQIGPQSDYWQAGGIRFAAVMARRGQGVRFEGNNGSVTTPTLVRGDLDISRISDIVGAPGFIRGGRFSFDLSLLHYRATELHAHHPVP